eukprot:2772602-Amphidinium_carterae.1
MRELRKLLLRSWLDAAEDSPVVEKWRHPSQQRLPIPLPPRRSVDGKQRPLRIGRHHSTASVKLGVDFYV